MKRTVLEMLGGLAMIIRPSFALHYYLLPNTTARTEQQGLNTDALCPSSSPPLLGTRAPWLTTIMSKFEGARLDNTEMMYSLPAS